MKSLNKLVCILLLSVSLTAYGQENSVGINTNNPNSNAVLDLVSPDQDQGFLVPRLSNLRRNAMIPNLTNNDNGLIVYDTDEGSFYYWKNGGWVKGLGVLSNSDVNGGDIEGEFPLLFIRGGVVDSLALSNNAVTTSKILNDAVTNAKMATDAISTDNVIDGAITGDKLEDLDAIEPGTYGNQFTVLRLTLDKKGRVIGFVETDILIGTENIENLSLLDEDIANGTITISKIDPDGNISRVLAINESGQVFWENRSNFVSSDLDQNNIYIGNNQNIAEGLPVGGDITATNSGSVAQLVIDPDAVTSEKILDNEVSTADIENGTILNEDVNAAAAIEGTKIAPDFGDQDITTTGVITGGTVTDGSFSSTGGIVTGVGSIDIDNINIDGNTISSTNTNGAIVLDPTPNGGVEVTSDMTIAGNVDVDGTTTLDEVNINTTDGDFVIQGPGQVAVDATNNSIDLTTNNIGDINLTAADDINLSADNITITGAFTPDNLDVDGLTQLDETRIVTDDGPFDVTGNGGVNVNQTSSNIDLATTTAGSITANAVDNVDVDAGALITLDGATGVAINAAANDVDITGDTNADIAATSGDVTLNAGDEVLIDATNAVSIDGTDNSNLTVSANDAANKALTLSATNTNTGEGNIDITADDNINLTATNINITGAFTPDNLDVDGLTQLDETRIVTDDGPFDVTGNGGVNVNQTSSNIDLATTTAGSITANAVDNVDVDAGALITLDGATGVVINAAANDVDITGNTNADITATSGDVTLNAGDEVLIDAANAVSIDGTDNSNLTVSANDVANKALTLSATNAAAGEGNIDITADDNINLTATNINITGAFTPDNLDVDGLTQLDETRIVTDDGDFNVSGTNKALISSTNAGTDAIQLNATAGNVDIDGANGINLNAKNASNFTTATGDLDVAAAGQLDLDGNDVALDGATGVAINAAANDVDITGDTNADIAATSGDVTLNAGDEVLIDATTGVSIDGTDNSNLTVSANDAADKALTLSATNAAAGEGNIDITADDNINLTATNINITGAFTPDNLDVDGLTQLDETRIVTDDGPFDVTGNGGVNVNQTSSNIDLATTTAGSITANAVDNVDVDAGALITLDGATGVAINAAANDVDITGDTNADIAATSGDVTLNAGDEVLIDATNAVSIDGTDNSNLTVSANDAANKALTLAATNAAAGEGNIDITADDNINLTATNINITGAFSPDNLDVDGLTQLDETRIVTDDGPFDVTGNGGVNVNQTSSNIDLATTTAGSITANAVDNVDVDAGALITLDGATGVAINAAANDVDITGDTNADIAATSGDVTLNAGDEVLIDATTGVSIDGTDNSNLTVSANDAADKALTLSATNAAAGEGNIDITADDNINLTATNINITGAFSPDNLDVDGLTQLDETRIVTDDGDFNVSGTNKALISSTNAGTDAIQLNATAGNVDIDGANGINLNANNASNFTTATGDLDVAAAGQLDLDGNDVALDGATGVAINAAANDVDITGDTNADIAATSGDVTLNAGDEVLIDATTGVSIDGTDNSNLTVSANDAANKALTLSATNAAAGEGNIDITADDNINLTATNINITGAFSPDNLDVDGLTQLDETRIVTDDGDFNVSGTNKALISSTNAGTDAIQLNATAGNVDIDGANGINLNANNASNFTTATGDLDVAAAGQLDLDGNDVDLDAATTVSIDGTDNSNLTVSANDAANKALTLAATNAAAGEGNIDITADDNINLTATNINITGAFSPDNLDVDGLTQLDETRIVTDDGDFNVSGTNKALISSTNAGTDAIQLNATAGNVDIDGANGINLNANNASNFTTATGDLDVAAAGQLDLDGNDVALDGATGVAINAAANDVDITGDTNADIAATSGDVTLNAGDEVLIDATTGVSIDGTDNSNLTVSANDAADKALTLSATNAAAGEGNIDITADDNINLTATNINITGAFSPDNLDVDGLTQLDETRIVTDDGDFNVSGTNKALISSTNAGTDAIQLNATAGNVDIDGANGINLNANNASNFTTATGDLDVAAAGQLDLDGNDVALDGATGVAINAAANDVDITGDTNADIAATSGDVTLNAGDEVLIDATTGVSIDGTDNSNLTVSANDAANKALTLSATNAAAGEGNIDITADDNINLTATNINITGAFSPDNLDVDGLTQLDETRIVTDDGDFNVSGTNKALISSTNAGTDAIQLNATAGNVDIDGANGINLNANNASNFTTATGDLDVAAAGQLDLDGNDVDLDAATTVSIDGTDNSNLTVSANDAANKALTLAATNAAAGEGNIDITADDNINLTATNINITGAFSPDNLDVDGLTQLDETRIVTDDGDFNVSGTNKALISSTNAGTDAIQLNATAGNVDIDGANGINLNANNASNFTTATGDLDVAAAGQLDLDGNDVALDGATGVAINAAANDVDITGDTNADIAATSGDVTLNAGDEVLIDATTGVSIDGTDNSNLTVSANDAADKALTLSATNAAAGEGNIDITADDNINLTATSVSITGTVQGLTTNNDIVFDETTNDLTLAVTDQTVGPGTLTIPDLEGASETIATDADLTGLTADVVLRDGTQALSANWDAGSFEIQAETFQSDVATGTAPLTVASTTVVTNLNADQLDGQDAPTGNIVGTSDAQTLTNKTIDAGTIANNLTFDETTNDLTLAVTDQTVGAPTLTIPDLAGTSGDIVVTNASQTLTNKTIDAGTITNDLTFDETTNDLTLAVTDQTVSTGTLTIPDLAGASRTIATTNDISSNNSNLVLRDGTQALTANWDAGSFEIQAETFQSDVATGTAPLTVASTTVVTNLNADQLDGQDAPTGNIVGTSDAQTLTNKTIDAGTIANNLTFDETTNDLTLAVTDQTVGAPTLTIPDLAGTSGDIVVTNASQTLTNKTIDAGTITNNLTFDETTNDLTLAVTDQTVSTGTLTIPDLAGASRTIATTNDISSNNSNLVLRDGTQALTANWDAGSFEIQAETFQSDVATGTAPLTVASTTVVTNLNADQLDGQDAPTGNIVGTSDAQTLTNKTIDAGTIANNLTFDEATNDLTLAVTDQTVSTGTLTIPDLAGASRTIATTNDISSNNSNLVLRDGTQALSANWDAGSFEIQAETFQSDVATGTAPLTVASTTVVTNLNADQLDGQDAPTGNIVGTSDAQTLTNKTIDAGTITNNLTFDEATNDLTLAVTDQTVSTGTLTIPDLAGASRTIATTNDISSNNSNLVLRDGTQALSANWDAGSFEIQAETFQSDVATGTAPLTVASTTVVTNLNADQLDGQDAPTGNIVGTSDAQTLTNKTIDAGTIANNLTFDETTNDLTLAVTDQTVGAPTLTIPDLAGTSGDIVVTNASQTLTNKTIDAGTITNDLTFDETTNDLTLAVTDQTVSTGTLTIPDLAGASRTIATTNDISSNNSNLVLRDGTQALTANWDAGSFEIQAETFQSDVATGTAPLTVASTTVVTNLNADQLDGQDAPTGNIVGTSDAQTLTNKTIDAGTIANNLTFDETTNDLTLAVTDQTVGAPTLTIPDLAGTSGDIVVTNASQTLTNKTIDAGTITNDLTFDETTNDLTLAVTDQTVSTGTLTIPDLAGASRTIATTNDISSNNSNLVLRDGTQALTANWDAGSFEIQAETFQSDVATGTAPLTVASTTVVTNLNADQLDGQDAPTGNIVGTSDAQTLTNKTIDAGTIANNLTFDETTNDLTLAVNDQTVGAPTLTIPDLAGTSGDIVVTNASQTLSNKTIDAGTITNNLTFDEATNDLTLAVTDQTVGAPTLTVPDLAGTSGDIVVTNASQTLTNKTVTSPTVSGDITFEEGANDLVLAAPTPASPATITLPDATGTLLSDASTLGTFTGSTIADNETVKGALQDLEDAVEAGPVAFEIVFELPSGTRSIANGSTIPFDDETLDTNNGFDEFGTDGTYTVQVSGLYHIVAQVIVADGDDKDYGLELRVNGSPVARTRDAAWNGNSRYEPFEINKIIQLSAADDVTLYWINYTDTNAEDIVDDPLETYFSGYLIRN